MLLKEQLKIDAWYKGFHPDFHVAKWTGSYFISFIDDMAVDRPHISEHADGFEPFEEIEAPPERLKNINVVEEEVKKMMDKANGIIDGM